MAGDEAARARIESIIVAYPQAFTSPFRLAIQAARFDLLALSELASAISPSS
jgi:hypothetical protein